MTFPGLSSLYVLIISDIELGVKRTKMWNERCVGSVDKFVLSSDKSITPYSSTPLFVPDTIDTSEFIHDFLKVEVTTIEEESYNSVRNPEVR